MSSNKPATAVKGNQASRRQFFIGAGATVGAAAIISQTPAGKAIMKEVATTVADKTDGYQASAHIRKYYETTLI
jgi:hypothetical protein